jgi:hypothetical protein
MRIELTGRPAQMDESARSWDAQTSQLHRRDTRERHRPGAEKISPPRHGAGRADMTGEGSCQLAVKGQERPLYPPSEPSALFLDGWLQFNREKWGVEPCPRRYTLNGKEFPALEAVLYLDRRGRVRLPPRNPYLAIRFVPAPGSESSPRRLTKQWLALSAQLAEELRGRGTEGSLVLPPGLIDGRAFQWRGFRVEIRYTYVGRLPHDHATIDSDVRRQCKKARRLGYSANRVTDWEALHRCLVATERAQGFSHRTAGSDLALCAKYLGPEHFYAFGGFAPDGEMVCADLELHVKGGVALGWAQGTCREHLSNGVTQLVNEFVLDRLTEDGAAGADWVGANMESVAAYKAAWGFDLVPFLVLREHTAINAARETASLVHRWVKSARSHNFSLSRMR